MILSPEIKKLFLPAAFLAGTIVLGFLAWGAYSHSMDAQHVTKDYVDKLRPKHFLSVVFGKILDGTPFETGNFKAIRGKMREAGAAKKTANIYTLAFAAVSVVFIAGLFVSLEDKQPALLAIMIISFLALIVGLSAPMLEIVFWMDVPAGAKIILQHQSKGILTTIRALFEAHNFIVGMALIVFSVLLPIAKNSVMAVKVLRPGSTVSVNGMDVVKKIGKWSMADVFVVAVVLSFLVPVHGALPISRKSFNLLKFQGFLGLDFS